MSATSKAIVAIAVIAAGAFGFILYNQSNSASVSTYTPDKAVTETAPAAAPSAPSAPVEQAH